ncbi:MAG: maleylpyruvate isomerase N-terminal domain-containing protein, partial [Thermoplasmata archaeon]|nr:maleylpyruvate isomerase N-terminal domain-containing protein [Thermoplasmata archaeon]
SGWLRLHALFAAIPQERYEEPSLTPEGWSAKDVMFHVGAWLAECAQVLERIRGGTFDPVEPEPSTEERNRIWFEISRRMEPNDVRAVFEGARHKTRGCFARLPSMTPDAWAWFEESGPLHYASHASDLSAVAGRIG